MSLRRIPRITSSNHSRIQFLALSALGLSFFACSNNLSLDSARSNYTFTGSSGTTGSSGVDVGTGTSALSLISVVKDNYNPTTVLDLIGNGSNSMGTLCLSSGTSSGTTTSSSSSTGTSGASTCSCTYSYTSPSLGSQQVDVDTVYHESNLLRCNYSSIPSDVTQFSVSVHVTSQSSYSNSVVFNLAAAGLGNSPTDPRSFSLAQRYQCRDVVTIPYTYTPDLKQANSVYDPIQSDDPSYSYPLNFYSTNLGGTYAQYIAANVTSWNCPANPSPSDSSFSSNYTLYSVGPDSNGKKTIYPSSGSAFDRSTFYVAKQTGGYFTVPLDAYVAPTLTANNINSPLGYGAAPIPIAGTSTETCPDSSTIPSGYQWVKVWLFRADLPDRRFLAAPNLYLGGDLVCNPGYWPTNQQISTAVFPDCYAAGFGNGILNGPDGSGIPISSAAFVNGTVADRVIAGALSSNGSSNNNMCVALGNYTGISPIGPGLASPNASYLDPLEFALGTDRWYPKSSSVTYNKDPMDVTGLKFSPYQYVPKDFAPITMDLDNPIGASTFKPRYDFVFVVTPVTVMAEDMENSSNTSNYPYVPYRFPNASDCLSQDPDNPSFLGDCDPSKIIHYGLKLHDVSSNGDPPASDPNRAGVFPMCAIQPN